MVQAHTQGMVNVDLDLGCMYELADGTKGVVQPLGGFLGDLNDAAVHASSAATTGSGRRPARRSTSTSTTGTSIKRLLVFVYIYDQTPAFDRTHAIVTLYPEQRPADRDRASTSGHPQARSCAVC